MNPLYERYPDIVNEHDDPALLACITDLDATCAKFTLPRETDEALAGELMAAHSGQPSRLTTRTVLSRRLVLPSSWSASRWRLAPALLALLLVAGGIGAYLHGSSPTTVNAQTVLHRAAAASPGPNEATHATYRVSSSNGHSGSADVWIGYDGAGEAIELALKLKMSQNGHPADDLSASLTAAGPMLFQVYDKGTDPGQVPVPDKPDQLAPPRVIPQTDLPGQALKGIVVGTLLAQKLSAQPDTYKLHQETLDGVSVYALQFTRADGKAGGATFYFNAQSYVLDGADWTARDGVAWHARLDPSSYQTMPLSAVPAHTFPATLGGMTVGSEGFHAGAGEGTVVTIDESATSGGRVRQSGSSTGPTVQSP